jgi:hypothetical protein
MMAKYIQALIKFLTTQFESEEEKENELVRLRYLSYETKEMRVLYMHMRHLQMTGIAHINLQESFEAKKQ